MANLLGTQKNKTNTFVLFFSRFFVTLALPKLLALGKAKEKHVFILLFSRFSVTLHTKSDLYMKENSEKTLQSPDKIADHLRVTFVPAYLLATTIALLLAAFIVWGVLGTVSDKVYYSGVVFPVQGTTDVTLPNKGMVRTMLVQNGDSVHLGQRIAMVSVGESYSLLTSTVSGLVISAKADNELFEAFEPIVSVVDDNGMVHIEATLPPHPHLMPGITAFVTIKPGT